MTRSGTDTLGRQNPGPVVASRLVSQPALALGYPGVASAVRRIEPFIENLEFGDELIAEAIGMIAGDRRIRSGSDLFRRLTFGRPAVGMILFLAIKGRSIDLISAGQALVIAVRDLVAAERDGTLPPVTPRAVARRCPRADETAFEPEDHRAERVRRAWERIRPAPEGFGMSPGL